MNKKEQLILRMNIEKYLEEKGIKQSQLSLDSGYISKVINGKIDISDNNLQILAKDLEVSLEQLKAPNDYERYKKYMGESSHLLDKYDKTGQSLIRAKGADLIENLKEDGVDGIIYNVLCGGNVRDITEFITRNRLLISNAALTKLMIEMDWSKSNGNEEYLDFLGKTLQMSSNNDQRIIALWLLGLTQKGLDNIVRGRENLYDYIGKFNTTLNESMLVLQDTFGDIQGQISLNGETVEVNWNFLNLLFTALGAQTLTLRGSSKSMNGKLFERLILGSALSMLGFKYCSTVPKEVDPEEKLFWLSSTEENERETDATLAYNKKAISIDIGFIGKGNPEIASDKMTRFRSEKSIGNIDHLMRTIVIVDTIGANSNLTAIARGIEGSAIEMKDKNWMKNLAIFLSKSFECECVLENIDDKDVHQWIKEKLDQTDNLQFI